MAGRVRAAVAVLAILGGAAHAAEIAPAPVTGAPLPRWMSLKAEAFARRGPGKEHRIDWVFRHRGTPLRVVAQYEHWRKVVDAEGTGGWVHYSLLRGTRTVLFRAVPETALREEPDAGARVVALAMPGAIAALDACRADWCHVAAGVAEGWVPKTEIWGVDAAEAFE
jgi:SH3-like domain-containing protein